MSRRVEVTGPDGRWREVQALAAGDVFRMFDAATGAPVVDSSGCWRWRALAAAIAGGDVDAEPVPETDVEIQARAGGYFPGPQTGFGRLRGR